MLNAEDSSTPDTSRITGLHHVAVQTRDLDEAIKFYTDVLGMKLQRRGPFKKREIAWLQFGNTLIELLGPRTGDVLLDWSDQYVGPIHLAFVVPDLDAFLAEAMGRGAAFHPSHPEPFQPPIDGARRIAYLLGPDGEEVEIRESN